MTGSCPSTPSTASVPRHYWKTSVEWCQNRIAVGATTDPWRGAGGSACKAFRDTSTNHIYPRFYRFGRDPGTDNVTQPAFQRVDLHPGIVEYYHEWKDESGDVVSVSRTYVQEMENYANWFAYYRTRIQAVKTATSLVFKELDNKFRVGFHTLGNNPTSDFANVGYFDAAQKTTWFSKLYGVYIKTGQETPNLNAVVRVGEWYATGTHPQLAAASDPIVPTLTCQKNWHMLFTDGITNQPAVPTTVVGNVDRLIPVLPEDLSVQGLVPGQPWPFQFRENATATNNSLADYVTYYWSRDFKPAMTNNVPSSDRDPATWQHGNFAAMSLGTEGKLATGNQASTEDQIKAGTTQWSQTVPNVYKPDASGVDDLWHAAINGRGRFVNAQSVDELRLGMGQILKDIENQPGSRSGVSFDSVNLSDTNKFIYRVKFEPGWAGSLTKVEIDPSSGAEVLEKWRAADRLSEQLTVLPAPDDQPWLTKRKILTMNGTSVVPFRWGSLSATQQDSLAPGRPTRGAQTVEYLRGDRSREGARLGQFRVRSGPLGDIVNSQPVIVGPPKPLAGTTSTPFYDPGLNPGYQAFFDAHSARQKTIFVGANDGMVHAFSRSVGGRRQPGALRDLQRVRVVGVRAEGSVPRRQDRSRRSDASGRRAAAVHAPLLRRRSDARRRCRLRRPGLADHARRRSGQGRQVVLRTRRHDTGRDGQHRGGHHRRPEGAVGVHARRHGLFVRQAADGQDQRARLGRHPDLGLQQSVGRRQGVLRQPQDRHAADLSRVPRLPVDRRRHGGRPVRPDSGGGLRPQFP